MPRQLQGLRQDVGIPLCSVLLCQCRGQVHDPAGELGMIRRSRVGGLAESGHCLLERRGLMISFRNRLISVPPNIVSRPGRSGLPRSVMEIALRSMATASRASAASPNASNRLRNICPSSLRGAAWSSAEPFIAASVSRFIRIASSTSSIRPVLSNLAESETPRM